MEELVYVLKQIKSVQASGRNTNCACVPFLEQKCQAGNLVMTESNGLKMPTSSFRRKEI